MTGMDVEVIGVLIPIIAILGAFGFAAFRHWTGHCERMEELRQRNLDRAAQSDRELLSYDSDLQSAHLTAILERLSSIEQRLGEIDSRPRTSGTVAASSGWDEETRERQERREPQTQQY